MIRESQLVEFDEYITPDGVVYDLDDHDTRFIISGLTNTGMPTISYVTQRGPFQDGETVDSFVLERRVMQMAIRQQYRNRDEYWSGRNDLLNALRPTRQDPSQAFQMGTLKKYRTDGSIRCIDVVIERGPSMRPVDNVGSWDEWAIQEGISFVAFDPTFYDPTFQAVGFSFSALTDLVFPITFPITWGGSTIDTTTVEVYDGTYAAFPVLTIVGPLTSPILTNSTTGEYIELSYAIPIGRTVTIDLRNGVKRAYDDLGTNLTNNITPASDLSLFHIEPEGPLAVGGSNSLRLQGSNALPGATEVTVVYRNRYIGI